MNGMDCAGFEKLVNDYLDNELDMESRARMEAHVKNCPECGRLLDEATSILTRCAELDEGLVMPLEAQTAWRRAVREEASMRRGRKTASWVRTAGAVAAALVVLVGGTFMLRGNKAPLSLIQANTGVATQFDMEMEEDAADGEAYPMSANTISGGGQRMFFDADGAMDEDAYAEPDVAELDRVDDAPTGSDAGVSKDDIKLLRSASRDIETSDFDDDLQALKNLVEEYNGIVESENTYGQKITAERPDGRFAYLNLRIPSGNEFDAFLTSLNAVGTITSRSEYAEDISMQYYDAKTRLDNQKAFRASLQAMVSSAQNVTELIEIQRSLANVQTEIDTLEGQLRGWDSRVSLASVNVSMREVAKKDAVNPIVSASLGERLRSSFYASINAFSAFLQDMMVFVVLVWPWLLLAVVACVVIGAVVRRRRRAK